MTAQVNYTENDPYRTISKGKALFHMAHHHKRAKDDLEPL
jgi:hypothetical protein